jgi:hypothetical protein
VAKYSESPSGEMNGDRSLAGELTPLRFIGADHVKEIGAETAGRTARVTYSTQTGQAFV